MKNYYNENKAVLDSRNFLLPDFSNSTSSIEVIDSKSGHRVPSALTKDGKRLFIHSRIDPVREAERVAAETDFKNRDLVVVLGFGFGYLCEAILDKCDDDTFVLVIEKDKDIFRRALENRDLKMLLEDSRLGIIIDPAEEMVAQALKGRSSRRSVFVTHRGSFQIYPDYYSEMSISVKSFVSTKDVNIATLSKFEKTWVSNISRNIRTISNSPGASIFFEKFKGIPAIVAGAGPSLIKSLDFIRENMHRSLIVAVDTSYKILLDNGIVPHFCIAVDPQIINARYLEGTGETSTVLVADPTVHPSIPRFFKGPMVMTGVAFEMMKWIESALPPRGELAHGGSVSTNAYDFARQTGASPVILVGQDLSFTSGLAHARGSYLDEQMYKRINRFNTPQMFNRKQLSFMPKIMVPGKNNYPVHSNSKMMIFINWFENRKDPSLINASADGVFIKGIKNIKSNEISFNESNVHIQDLIDDLIYSAAKSRRDENHSAVLKKAAEMLAEIEELIPVLEKGIRFGADLKEMLKSGKDKSDPGKMGYIIKKLSETDAFIESRTKAGPMISFSIQRIIHSITEGYGTGDGDNAGTRSEFLYKGMLEGALFSKKVLGKMKVLLVNQA